MAKTSNDIAGDLDRQISFALHSALDDAEIYKVDPRDVEVACLQALSHALCSMAYVCGLDKAGFINALTITFDNVSLTTKDAIKKVEEYLEGHEDVLKDVERAFKTASPTSEEDKLKN